jgi:transposase-like protein
VNAISNIQSAIKKLGVTEVLEVEQFISQFIRQQALEVNLAKRAEQITKSACPHCGFIDLIRWGKSRSGTQRFKCRNCRATFGATNNTPFFRLRNRHLWSKYLGLMGQHVPLWRLREDHGLRLSIPTLHRWRHRFLSALTADPTQPLAGLIEADEKFFRTSYKGSRGFRQGQPPQARKARRRGGAGQRGLGAEQVPTLTAKDRSGAIRQARLPDMKWSSISEIMNPWIEPESVICSDGNLAYQRVAQQTGCEHMIAKTGGQNARGISLGRIDAYHRDVENLVNRRCMGVGTRYLLNYFGWARRITQHKPFGNDLLAEMLAA